MKKQNVRNVVQECETYIIILWVTIAFIIIIVFCFLGIDRIIFVAAGRPRDNEKNCKKKKTPKKYI